MGVLEIIFKIIIWALIILAAFLFPSVLSSIDEYREANEKAEKAHKEHEKQMQKIKESEWQAQALKEEKERQKIEEENKKFEQSLKDDKYRYIWQHSERLIITEDFAYLFHLSIRDADNFLHAFGMYFETHKEKLTNSGVRKRVAVGAYKILPFKDLKPRMERYKM